MTFTMSCPTSVALTVTSNGLVGFQKKELLYSGSQTQSLVKSLVNQDSTLGYDH